MNELTTFTNAEFGAIRTVQIDDDPWFVGKDVALALGYSNSAKAVRDHVDGEDKQTERIVLSGQNYNVTVINESGLYCLILSSKLPGAKRFKRWVTGEVLPALRKTGRYETEQNEPEEPVVATRPLTPDDYLRAASIVASCRSERLPYALLLLGKAGIDVDLLPGKRQRKTNDPEDPDGVEERDTATAELINTACSEYGVSMRAIARATGLYAMQISRYRTGESFPKPARAAIIQNAVYSLVPELRPGEPTE